MIQPVPDFQIKVVSFDGKGFEHPTESSMKGKFSPIEYISVGYFRSKIGAKNIESGEHRVEIKLDGKRLRDGSYTIY